jgi:hypothetical protein
MDIYPIWEPSTDGLSTAKLSVTTSPKLDLMLIVAMLAAPGHHHISTVWLITP